MGALNCAVYLHEEISFFQIIMILLGSAFLSSGLMVHNDVTDLKSDEINRPHKPLPSGYIKCTNSAYHRGPSDAFLYHCCSSYQHKR